MKLPLPALKNIIKTGAAALILTISISSCSSSHQVCDAYTLEDNIQKIEQIKSADKVSSYN